jgi:taurine dioxygenase
MCDDALATMHLELQTNSCGALIHGVDLSRPLVPEQISAIRSAWLAHQVVAFPGQALSLEDIERFAFYIGPRGEDPFIAGLPDHPHVVEVKREAQEKSKLFAETWHSDWSFLPSPPAGTVLYGEVIPPVGGDTLFADQYAAFEALPAALKAQIDGRLGVHSARGGYARDGLYGEKDEGRSMAIRWGDNALKTRSHPLVKRHPETGRKALFVNPGYTIGIEGMGPDEGIELLRQLFRHQTDARFVYRHKWQAGMLTLWDNRCLLHAATGGYEGHRRLLYRVTVAERLPS